MIIYSGFSFLASSEEHEDEKLDTDEYLEHIDVPNDTEERSQSTMAGQYHEDIHHEQTHSACNESLGIDDDDDALIQKQMSDERGQ